MPFTPLFGTGFESGSVMAVHESRNYAIMSAGGQVHTGSYAVRLYESGGEGFVLWRLESANQSELYVTMWVYPYGNSWHAGSASSYVAVRTNDGQVLKLRWNYDRFEALRNSTVVATGAIVPATQAYFMLEVHFKIGDADGAIGWKIDQVQDANSYVGDTNVSGSSTRFDALYLGNATAFNDGLIFDDVCVGYGDWPGDIRFDVLQVTGDSAVAWSRSTGATNWSLVDEKPPADSDYVYSSTNTQKDLYTLADWSGSGKIPLFLNVGVRAKKSAPTANQLALILKSGGTEYTVNTANLKPESFSEQAVPVLKDPNGDVDWTNAAINALLAGYAAVIAP